MHKQRLNRGVWWRTVGLITCLLALAFSALSQTKTQNRVAAKQAEKRTIDIAANASEAQRRTFAASMVISLATEARSYKDLALRTRVLARAADALWDTDRTTARALFPCLRQSLSTDHLTKREALIFRSRYHAVIDKKYNEVATSRAQKQCSGKTYLNRLTVGKH